VKITSKKEALSKLYEKFEPRINNYEKEEYIIKIRNICKMMHEDIGNREFYKDVLRKILECSDSIT
jgi:hypothetical protein